MGNKTEFEKGVWWLVDNLNFDMDKNVSLFETNIRVVGGNIRHTLYKELYVFIYIFRITFSSFISVANGIGSFSNSPVQ